MCTFRGMHLILSIFAILVNNVCWSNQNSTFENIVDMVRGNLTSASTYKLPVNNEKLCYVKPPEQDTIYDYGTFDFVVIGAGSAGTLLTNRLSEIKGWNVLLLEAGGRGNEFSDIPGMAHELYLSDMNWGYLSTPQKRACLDDQIFYDFVSAMDQNKCVCPRGKVVGGSSTINAKMYVRGNKVDYDTWEVMGNHGWSYNDVLPYFIKTENSHIFDDESGYHGTGGLLDVDYPDPTIFTSAYLNGMEELGYKVIDYNGQYQIGASQIQCTINSNKIASGERAFINPFLERKNLNLTVDAFVTKLIIDKETKTALGAEFIRDGRQYKVRAKREVILSAGAINTPQILMISGIGPQEELNRIGVETIVDLPVGKDMEDHALFIGLNIRTNQTLFNDSIEVLLKNYLNNHRPFTAAFNADSQSFINVNDKGSSVPDIQHMVMTPPRIGRDEWKIFNLKKEFKRQLKDLSRPYNDIAIWLVLLHPKSNGTVTLKSNNPLDFPNIDYNYYAVEEDVNTMLKAINEALKLLETKAFKSINASYVPTYKICIGYTETSDEYWRCMLKQLTTTLYHPVGTTRMGKSKEDSVVSSNLCVHGMKRLRVVDAGVMPKIPSGNTNAPTYMIAEKAADKIRRYWIRNDESTYP